MFFMFDVQFIGLMVGLGLGTSTTWLEFGECFVWAYHCEEPNAKNQGQAG